MANQMFQRPHQRLAWKCNWSFRFLREDMTFPVMEFYRPANDWYRMILSKDKLFRNLQTSASTFPVMEIWMNNNRIWSKILFVFSLQRQERIVTGQLTFAVKI